MKNNLIVLIVDDNMGFSDRMCEILEGIDLVDYISVAGDYEEGRRLFFEHKPGLVLLDINLPGKNGIHLLREITKSDWDCQVIMMTNHTSDHYRQQCTSLGAKYFLDKSNDFALVPSIINQGALI
jgi:DNA-binding NarL/FixJ family response regulator